MIVPVWVKLPYFPLHCWNDVTFRLIGDSLEKYIDCVELKDRLFTCAQICVEVDLDKELSVSINVCMDI